MSSKDSQSAAKIKQPLEKGETSSDGNQPVASVNELVQKEEIGSLDSQSAANIKQPLENEERGKTHETKINEQRKTGNAYEQSTGVPNEIPGGDTVGTARMEERKPQLEDELEQCRTKENFSNFMKKYFEKQEEVDSLNTELENVRKAHQAQINELTSVISYAYYEETSLRLQICELQHPENSQNPNQNIESSTRTEDRDYLLKQKIEALEGVKKIQADHIKELKMKLHAYEQSSNVPNGVPLDDTIDTANLKEFEMSVFAMEELDHSPQQLERQFEQFSIQDGEDNEDGTNRAQGSDNSKQENSFKMPQFREEYYCPVSCVSRVVSFIFDRMELPVCNTRLHKEVQNELCLLSKFTVVGKCSLAFKEFYDVGLIEKKHTFFAKIENSEERGRRLKEAIATMMEESHPALFRMHYKENQDGTKRAGHCLAIMPDGEFIEVKEKCQWKPEQDQLWKSVNLIEVWKVGKKAAKEWEKKCGLKICIRECKHSRNAKEKHT